MTIAVFEHDDTHAAQLNQILGESGYLDAHSAKHLDQLRDTLGMTPQSSEPAAGSNMRVHVSLLILSVDQGESALDFLRQLKSDVRYKDIPVVVIPGADHFFHRKLHHIKQLVINLWIR